MQPFEFLTVTPNEARLIVSMLHGHLPAEGITAHDELGRLIADSGAPKWADERLDLIHVANWGTLGQRIYALTEPQAQAVLDAAAAFWDGDLDLYVDEGLQMVGLLKLHGLTRCPPRPGRAVGRVLLLYPLKTLPHSGYHAPRDQHPIHRPAARLPRRTLPRRACSRR